MIVQDTMQYLSQLDPEVGASVQEEFARQQRNIELIASENIVSPAVMVAMGTCLTNKYAEYRCQQQDGQDRCCCGKR